MFSEVSGPWWDTQDVYIIGGGPSLAGKDLTRLKERGIVLGINKAFNPAPGTIIPCHATFTIDHLFLRNYAERLTMWAKAGQEVYAAVNPGWFQQNPAVDGVRYLQRMEGRGWRSTAPHLIINGKNSGYSGLCLALAKRAKRVWLLGFDMTGNNAHWHEGYPWGGNQTAIYFGRWAAKFQEIATDLPKGVEVINCNPRSGIRAFPFTTYDAMGIN